MADDFDDEGTLVLEQRFAIVPEWVIDADISDCAFRLYAVLLRYGQTSGQRMPGRALLARRLRKGSKDTVDRALKDLVRIGAVRVERRRAGRQSLTNRYHVMATPPTRRGAGKGGSRKTAATPGRRNAATPGPIRAATRAADLRPNPVVPTEKTPPPTPPVDAAGGGGGLTSGRRSSTPDDLALLATCGIDDLEALAAECAVHRQSLGRSATRWSAPRLLDVLRQAVAVEGWPPETAAAALLGLAADPTTRSPMRLAAPGPWWDTAAGNGQLALQSSADELATLEARLAEIDGRRLWLQRQARAQLSARGEPVTRLSVARRACQLLDETDDTAC